MFVDNSMLAYITIIEELNNREKQVYSVIDHCGPVTNKEIAAQLNIPINCVTGRTNSLVKKNVVVRTGDAVCKETGRPQSTWEVVKKLG